MVKRERRGALRQTRAFRAVLSLREGGREFDAGAATRDISPEGAFLESAFIMRVGTVLDIAFEIPGLKDSYRTRATVIREQAPAIRDAGFSIPGNVGFAVRFHEPFTAEATAALRACAVTPPKAAPVRRTSTEKATKKGKTGKRASKTTKKTKSGKKAKTGKKATKRSKTAKKAKKKATAKRKAGRKR